MNAIAALFTAGAVFLVYVLAGYPLLLAVYARLFPKRITKQPAARRVSVIVPVRNGARWIEGKIQSILGSRYQSELLDVLVVSDGSIDGTNELVELYPDSRVRLLALPSGGKAIAVTHGLKNATGEIIVLTDVRQAFDCEAIARLVACFADDSVGVVTGELVIREGSSSEEFNTGLYWRYEKWIRRNLSRIDAMPGATGCIYAIRRELAAAVPAGTLLDDVYLPLRAVFRGFRIYFEDGAKAYDVPASLELEFWRKVRTQAGVYQILFRFPQLLWPGNRMFIHFLSHKIGRLLLPFALVAVAVGSFGLSQPWRDAALGAQIVFYGTAVLDPIIPERFALKRITSVVRAFVVLVAAAFCAVVVFIVPAQTLWKDTRAGNTPAAEQADTARG
jgi:cellulose synthase/poly-beta-1,6-N-acetylglucosamine synthase-like glycosyltransferase